MKITNDFKLTTIKASEKNKVNDVYSASSPIVEQYVASKYDRNKLNSIGNYSINQVARNRLVNTASYYGMQSPNWETIPTRGMNTLPMDELILEIKELGGKLAKAKSEEERDATYYQVDQLLAKFVSPVSPDRKLLYKQAMKAIHFHEQKEHKLFGEYTLVDYLNQYDGIKTSQGLSAFEWWYCRTNLSYWRWL